MVFWLWFFSVFVLSLAFTLYLFVLLVLFLVSESLIFLALRTAVDLRFFFVLLFYGTYKWYRSRCFHVRGVLGVLDVLRTSRESAVRFACRGLRVLRFY